MRFLALCVVLALTACGGPSSQEIATAKSAQYRGSADELYSIAKQVAAFDYKIGEEDPVTHRFATDPQWYSPEGGRQSPGAGNMSLVVDHSVMVSLVVEIVSDGDRHIVTVRPVTYEYMTGSPQPRPLSPDDPNLPPWIHGRADALALAIHKHAQRMEIR